MDNADKRPSWHEYFFGIAEETSKRSTCPDAHVGAVYVRDHNILAISYNGAPRGFLHCDEVGCLITKRRGSCERAIHAEINGIIQAARHGVVLSGSEVYVTAFPCYNCFIHMANLPVAAIYWDVARKPHKHQQIHKRIAHEATHTNIRLMSRAALIEQDFISSCGD